MPTNFSNFRPVCAFVGKGADGMWHFYYSHRNDLLRYKQPGQPTWNSAMNARPRCYKQGFPLETGNFEVLTLADLKGLDMFQFATGTRDTTIVEYVESLLLKRVEDKAVVVITSNLNPGTGEFTMRSRLATEGTINTSYSDSKDPLAPQAKAYPAYWRPLPKNWSYVDTYRVDTLFPLNDSRLTHARKKLLVPGTRTGGKSFYHDVKEAHATLGQWLIENKPE